MLFRVPGLNRDDLGPVALTLGCGLLGGFVFNYFRMPLPWMLGAMSAVTALALTGHKVRIPGSFRQPMIVIIGVMLGSTFTIEFFERADEYVATIALVAIYVVLASAVCMVYLCKVGRYDPVTAYFSSIPGGLMEMLVLASSEGADERKFFLTQATRVFAVVFTIPFWYRLVEGYIPQSSSALGAPLATISLGDLAILTACGVAGYYLGKVLRFPAYRLTGPLLLSAAAHLSGLTASKPPGELIILAQLVLGSIIGTRFVGVRLIEMLSTVRIALGSALILLSLAFICTYALQTVTGIDSKILLLTLSPGGLAEMTLIALTLGIDVAFITVHHLMRIVMAVFVAPLVFKVLKRFLKPQENDGSGRRRIDRSPR